MLSPFFPSGAIDACSSRCAVLHGQATHGNQTLRHLDLRHAGLQGAKAATVIGEMLRKNTHLSHLDLSWNPLDPAGGQVLYEQMQVELWIL